MMYRTYIIHGISRTKMNNKILSLLKRPIPLLVFGLLSGCAYFAVILQLISGYFSGTNRLIVWYFSPVIICGAALVLLKLIKQHYETDNHSKILAIFWIHIILMLIAIALTAAAAMV